MLQWPRGGIIANELPKTVWFSVTLFTNLWKFRQGEREFRQPLDPARVAPAHGGELERFPGQEWGQKLPDDCPAERKSIDHGDLL